MRGDKAVGIATGYELDGRRVGVQAPEGSRFFTSRSRPDRLWGSMGTEGPCPGVKRPGREADHSPPNSAEVKKTWVYTSTPPYVFMA
jgi:hypothetical protein